MGNKKSTERPPGMEARIVVEPFNTDAAGNPVDADGRPVVLHFRPGCFTPPPWRARKTSLLSNNYLIAEDARPDALVIATVRPRAASTGNVIAEVTNHGGLLNRRPEHEANAYLVEQSPNLYHAVRNLLTFVATGEGKITAVADAEAVLAAVDRDRVGDLMAGIEARVGNLGDAPAKLPEEDEADAAVLALDAARDAEEKAEAALSQAQVKLSESQRQRRHAESVSESAEARKANARKRRG